LISFSFFFSSHHKENKTKLSIIFVHWVVQRMDGDFFHVESVLQKA